MKKFFVQLYGDVDDSCNTRLIESLEYYMFETKKKDEMIYFIIKEQSIFIVLSDGTEWTSDKLMVLLRTELRQNAFLLLSMDYYNGYMSIWDKITTDAVNFYKDPKAARITMGRGSKLSKLLNKIMRNNPLQKDTEDENDSETK
jgi:hypothetical protein